MKGMFITEFNRQRLDVWLLLLRILVGTFMLTHGLPKFYKLLAGDLSFGDPIGIGEPATLVLAVFSEVICSTFILIGLGTRLAAIPLIATMVVAAFVAHGDDPFGRKELPLLYLFIYITFLILGSGKYSIAQKLSSWLKLKDSSSSGYK